MDNQHDTRDRLEALTREVSATGDEDGLLGAPALYRDVISWSVEILAEQQFAVAARGGPAALDRRLDCARQRRDRATRVEESLAGRPHRPVGWSILAAMLASGAAATAAGAYGLTGRGTPERWLALGLGAVALAAITVAVVIGPTLADRVRRLLAALERSRAGAAIDALQDEVAARADQELARARWIELHRAHLDAVYLFHRDARGALAAAEPANDSADAESRHLAAAGG